MRVTLIMPSRVLYSNGVVLSGMTKKNGPQVHLGTGTRPVSTACPDPGAQHRRWIRLSPENLVRHGTRVAFSIQCLERCRFIVAVTLDEGGGLGFKVDVHVRYTRHRLQAVLNGCNAVDASCHAGHVQLDLVGRDSGIVACTFLCVVAAANHGCGNAQQHEGKSFAVHDVLTEKEKRRKSVL